MAKKVKLTLHYKRFLRVLRVVEHAIRENKGFFENDWRRAYLPQWSFPEEFENTPRTREVAKPYEAGLWLFTRNSLDRLSQSRQLLQYARRAWQDGNKRWVFYPDQVVARDVEDVEQALKVYFNMALPVSPQVSAGAAYKANCKVMLDEYDGDVRKAIHGRPIADAWNDLEQLQGFGQGLARLLITEMYSRRIAIPSDPEQLENKIDRHKAGIPLNTEAMTTRAKYVNLWSLVNSLQDAYRRAFGDLEIAAEDIDAAMWVIGSEGCATQDMHVCRNYCPLSDIASGLCVRASSLGHSSGTFKLIENRRKVDRRKKDHEERLFDVGGMDGFGKDIK